MAERAGCKPSDQPGAEGVGEWAVAAGTPRALQVDPGKLEGAVREILITRSSDAGGGHVERRLARQGNRLSSSSSTPAPRALKITLNP